MMEKTLIISVSRKSVLISALTICVMMGLMAIAPVYGGNSNDRAEIDKQRLVDDINCAADLIAESELSEYESYGMPYTEQVLAWLIPRHCGRSEE